ncbi:MAG: glycerol-3-phosphate 1-O-acyltransferase PlsY [Deltaproteobacteria bacterium]|nr:glycerol-3-phosphate 1-O-acyltransferase PlsY [Deltaproteobacteria bacterium]
MILNILLIVFAYLLGSIPTGLLLSKALAGKDPRQQGSRNIGATNVMRTAGKTLGAVTLIGDVLKGLIPVVIALWLGREQTWVAGVGVAAFLGHCFSIYLRFKGGKGVATALGIFLPLAPLAVFFDILFFAGVVVACRIVSVGSILGAVAMPILIWLVGYPLPYVILGICVAALIIYRHKENIQRLMAGGENKFLGKS